MATLWIRWFSRIVVAIAVIAALALPWALSWLWRWLPKQWDVWIIVAIITDVTLVLLAGIWWLWWRLPQHQVARLALKIRDPKARADTEDNFRKTVGQALGGAAVLIGAGAAYLQFTQQQQASHDLMISNQVAKSFEQLGSTEIATRLGGIYGLEGVMNASSSQYRVPVLEALCAFVREGTTRHHLTVTTFLAALFPAAHDTTAGKGNDAPATDVQAALTVIGRRTPTRPGRVNLTRANIPDANLWEAHLEDANLSGAHLERANLDRADLDNACLDGTHLEGASLRSAHLEGVDLRRAVGLTEAQLAWANGDAATRLPAGLARPDNWDAGGRQRGASFTCFKP